MIWFLIFISLFIASIITCIICYKNYWDGISIISTIFGAFSGVILVLMILIIVIENTNAEGKYITKNVEREGIVQLYESDVYLNDNNVGAIAIYEKINSWNKEITAGKTARKSPWINWFYGSYYDRLELIEYK